MTSYKVVITYDPEYKGYVVDVPELVGCMSQGKTIDEALENVKDAIRGWLRVDKQYRRRHKLKPIDILLGEVAV